MPDYQVLVHYHNPNGDYLSYNIWQWQENQIGKEASFSNFDYFGRSGLVTYQSETNLDYVHLIIKKADWSSQTIDYTIRLLPSHLVTEVWILEGDHQVYYSRQAAVASHFYKYRDPHAFDMAVSSKEFDRYWGYQGSLGAFYQSDKTEFKIWAPTAKAVEVVIYKDASNQADIWKTISLKRGRDFSTDHTKNTIGVWQGSISEDLAKRAYQYQVTFDHEEYLARDPYSQATSPDGKRTAIVTDQERNPLGFQVKQGQEAHWRVKNACQAVIYEMHIRDLTKSESSGVAPAYRGTFLGACQRGTTNDTGQATTFDYIRDLGVNYVQLQPVSDRHKNYDENGQVPYNWGYDPQNYNAPETSLSSNPSDPAQAIRDLKTLIQAYHDAGIGVILDVVYNHIYSTFDSPFQASVPDYYYRMNPDGSFQNGTGVGSETASEHEMFRKYMIDSILYWVKEYNIDGFRFDLMGIHDVKTMQAIRWALDEVDPRIITYGEGWDMGTGLAPYDKAKKDNAYQMPNIGFFNDDQRDAIKGGEVYGAIKSGFVSGAATEPIVAKAILGSRELGSYLSPNQVLNYVEAHDNYNLHDLLATLHPDHSSDKIMRQVETATAMSILMQGMSFIELGQEFGRTKLLATGENGELTPADRERAMNSYNAPDSVNQVNWDLINERQESIDFIRQIIRVKTQTRAFSYPTYEEVYRHVFVHTAAENSGWIVYEIHGGAEHLLVVFNAKGTSFYFENAGNLEMLVSNSRSKESNVIDDISVAVLKVLS